MTCNLNMFDTIVPIGSWNENTHTHTHCHYVCIILGMLSSISTTDTKATTISQHFFIKCSQSFSSLQPLTIIYSRAPTQNQPLHHSQAKAPFHTIYSSCRSRPPGLYQCIKNSYTRIFFYVKQVSHHLYPGTPTVPVWWEHEGVDACGGEGDDEFGRTSAKP